MALHLEDQLKAVRAALQDAGLANVYFRGDEPTSLPSGVITIIDIIPGAPTRYMDDAENYEDLVLQITVAAPTGENSGAMITALAAGKLVQTAMATFGAGKSGGTQPAPDPELPYYSIRQTFSQEASYDDLT